MAPLVFDELLVLDGSDVASFLLVSASALSLIAIRQTGEGRYYAFMRRVLQWMYVRTPPADERQWHRWNLFWPVWLEDGLAMEVWRRRAVDGRWEYRRRPPTDDEWNNHQR